MPDLWMDVDAALSEVPVNIMPLLDDTDFKSRETGVAYNAAGMDLVWNFVTTAGAFTQTAVTPTTGGNYDWASQGDGMYSIEIPASGGASINNDTEGFGWFTGIATGVLPWRGPTIGFRAAALNNSLVDGATIDVNVTAMAAGVVTAAAVATGAIDADAIADNAIDAGAIAADAITAAKIATGAIDADALAADAGTEIGTAVWASANRQLTALDEDATTIDLNGTAVGSVAGAVGSVTGAVGSVTGAVGSVTGNVGGSVASVVAGVTVTTNNDKTGYGLSAAAVQAIWDALTSALTTAGSIGKRLVDYITGDIFGRLGAPAGASISADVAAVKADTAAILTDTGTTLDGKLDTIDGIVDAILVDTGTTLDALIKDVPTVAEFEARTLVAASYFDPAADTVANVTTVGSVTTKTGYELVAAYDAAKTAAAAGAKMDLIDAPNATAITAIQSGLATAASIAALNDVAAGEVADAVWDELVADHAGAGSTGAALAAATAPSAASVADAVWNETLADHLGAGSTGAGLNAAGSAGDPWATALPGAYGAGSAGKILGDNLNAPVGTVDTVVDAIKAKTDNLPASPAAVGSQMDLVNAPNATAVTAIQSGLATAATALSNATWTDVRAGKIDNLDAAISTRSTVTEAQVNAQADQALADYDAPTKAELDSAISTIRGADSDTLKTLSDQLDTAQADLDNPTQYKADVSALATSAEIAALNDVSAGEVADAVWDEALAGHAGAGSAGATLSAASAPTAAAVADAVWNEATADHAGAGTTGLALASAGAAGDPMSVAVPGAYAAGTAGNVLGNLADAVWESTPRTLTSPATGADDTTTATAITRRRGDTWSIAVSSLSLAGNADVWFAIKRGYGDADSAAKLLVSKTVGLEILNGAAAAVADQAKATIVVNAGNDTATITVNAAISAQFTNGEYLYDLQWKDGAGAIATVSAGTFTITGDVTRATA